MACVDSHITEAEAPAHDGNAFDEVRLASMGGSLGAKVWYLSHRIEDVAAGAPVKRPALERLLVSVEDDPSAEATVQRVRAKLQWLGGSSACPF